MSDFGYEQWKPEFLDVVCRCDEFGGLPPEDWPLLTEAMANSDEERVEQIIENARRRMTT